MPALPKIAGKLNIKVPKINPRHASYQQFLRDLAGLNYKHSAQLQKNAIDEQYAESLKQTFPKDPIAIRQLLDEVTSSA